MFSNCHVARVFCGRKSINVSRRLMSHDLSFGSDPPEHRSRSNQDDHTEQHDQCRLLDPGNSRDEERHDETEYANFHRRNVDAGNKCAKSQQKKNSEAGCVRVQHFLHIGEQQSDSWRQRKPANVLPGSKSGGVEPFYRPCSANRSKYRRPQSQAQEIPNSLSSVAS